MKKIQHVHVTITHDTHHDDLKYFQEKLGFNKSLALKYCLHEYRLIHEKENTKEVIKHV